MNDLIVGIGIALAFEGLLYAAFPEQARSFLRTLMETPTSTLRTIGLVTACIGVFLVWFIRG